jgi:hypothetical protein
MELSDYLRDPVYAALIAGATTAGYIPSQGVFK